MSRIDQSAVRNRLLSALPPADFGLLAGSLTAVDLPLKQALMEADEPIPAAYFIETGMTSYVGYLAGGEMQEIGLIGSEGVIGLPVVFGAEVAAHGAMVQMQGTAWRIDPASLRQAFRESEAIRNRLSRYMLSLHAQVAQTAVCNVHHVLEERLARWLLMAHDRAGGDAFPMTQEFMAMMLGVRRAGVTITAGALKQAGLISYAHGQMTVLDREGLEGSSCECYGIVQRDVERLVGADRV
ncbi:Crp/Fnr family transcriptional regulator [Azospirillum sp. SYSU D00513]|uniref:Crp/Fnr family transcriptional regulator n=1 Tax=Azospirillum sp. SYSU D00513 TaxID=2812561 RepID=UPI001A9762FB|nr:Crp/Fnr family transcriptional regulator [Azospirillum sp. SYSU D00513]